jgi:hypothetical protein
MPQFATCPCQLCSQKIEFETNQFQPGMTATCPHCGMETILFIPSGAKRQAAPARNDGCIFKNDRVTVTSALLTVGLSSFPISAISSFRVVGIPPNQKNIKRLTIFAILSLSFGLFVLALNATADKSSALALVFGLMLIGVGGLTLAVVIFAAMNPEFRYKITGRPFFGLNISTSASEQTIITSPELKTVDAIGDALRQAISQRG